MGRRLQRFTSEGAKFLTVGGVATLVSLVLFNALVHGFFGDPSGPMNRWPLPAFLLANLVGMLVSYRGSRSWAFRHRETVGAAGGRISFFVSNIVSANVIGLGLGAAARFWAFRRFIFLGPEKARARQTT